MRLKNKFLTAKTAKDIDAKAKNILGISTVVLMENAGRQVAEEAIKVLGKKKSVAIFCGKGNNGADGFVCARHLLTYSIRPDIFLAGDINEVRNEARVNLEILLKLRQKIIEVGEDNLDLVKNKILKYNLIHSAEFIPRPLGRGKITPLSVSTLRQTSGFSPRLYEGLIIDALLGVGLQGEVKGIYRDLIGIINTSKAYVLSVDIPSGLDATAGKVLGCCVKADKTVTFVAKKRGMVMGEGPKYCGRVVVKDLGIPSSTS